LKIPSEIWRRFNQDGGEYSINKKPKWRGKNRTREGKMRAVEDRFEKYLTNKIIYLSLCERGHEPPGSIKCWEVLE
jgi:hypothetical protein